MIERLEVFGRGRCGDILAVCVPNGVTLAAVNLVPVNHLVQLTAGLVTLGYAIWRWRRDSYVVCQACREGHPPAVCPLPRNKRPWFCPRKI